MRVIPPTRRSTVREGSAGFEISIPAKRNVFVSLFLTAWLVGWGFGEVFAARELLSGKTEAHDLFLAAWLVAWTVGGGAAFYAWLWMARGREVVLLRPDALAVRREVLGVGRTKEYDVHHVKNLRVAPSQWNPYDWSSGMQVWGIAGGPVAFEYGSRTMRFGNSLDEAEAREIVRELKARHSFPEVAA